MMKPIIQGPAPGLCLREIGRARSDSGLFDNSLLKIAYNLMSDTP